MMNKKQILFLLSVLLFGLSSCINDESSYGGNTIPTLTIEGNNNTDMPIVNFNLGEDCIIRPTIQYSGNSPLQYRWSIGTYKDGVKGTLEQVSTDQNLTYKFLSGGTYYAHLTVTDGSVGVAADYQININRTFEKGYLLVSNDPQGKGNLAFIKIMTPEEIAAGIPQISMEHIIERMNENISLRNIKGAIRGVITWPTTVHRILASTEDRCYFFDPNTFTIISNMNYEDVFRGFKATGFFADGYSPFVYDSIAKKFVNLNLAYMFPYEYKSYKGLTFDDCFQCSYTAWGNTNYTNMFVDYGTSEVKELDINTGDICTTGTILAEENIISAFLTGPQGYIRNELVLTVSKTNPSQYYLHEFAGIPYIAQNGPGTKTAIIVNSSTAVPKRGTRFAFSEKNNRYFYPIDNRIYVFLPSAAAPMPQQNEWAITFSEGEIITYMGVNADSDELYVATCTVATQRGNFYIYKCADIKTDNQGHITPVAEYRNVADRISSIIYKPSL